MRIPKHAHVSGDVEDDDDYVQDRLDSLVVYDSRRPAVVTHYGTVTPERITFSGKGRQGRKGVREDLAIRHITTVREEMARKPLAGLLVALAGAYGLFNGAGTAATALGVVLLCIGFLIFRGTSSVVINTSGGENIRITGSFRDADEISNFADAIRHELFRQ